MDQSLAPSRPGGLAKLLEIISPTWPAWPDASVVNLWPPPPLRDLVLDVGCSLAPRGSGDVPGDGFVVDDALAPRGDGVDERRMRRGALALSFASDLGHCGSVREILAVCNCWGHMASIVPI